MSGMAGTGPFAAAPARAALERAPALAVVRTGRTPAGRCCAAAPSERGAGRTCPDISQETNLCQVKATHTRPSRFPVPCPPTAVTASSRSSCR
ncbi:Conserved oligomeric Golgi complex component 8 [Burkholderia diffusa]|nr:Conserved oligomeric Golgi complex component 8 [Burkholderia diffusa]